MLKLPKIPFEMQNQRRETLALRGINFTDDLTAGDLADCENLSSARYPYLSVRAPRAPYEPELYQSADAVFSWDGHLLVANGGKLYYDNEEKCDVLSGAKQFAVVNTKLIIWPDKLYIDISDGTAHDLAPDVVCESFTLGAKYIQASADFGAFAVGDALDLTVQGGYSVSLHNKLCAIEQGKLTFEQNFDPCPVKCRENAPAMPDETFVMLDEYVENDVTHYDYALFDRQDFPAGKTLYLFRSGEACELAVWGDRGEEARVPGSYHGGETYLPTYTELLMDAPVMTVSRAVPDMDFVCESNNRLFGVSSQTRTVYASALGDPTRFWESAQSASGSYQVAVGSEGAFTGICALSGAVLCFKDHKLHKLLGSTPKDFRLYDYTLPGVQSGCAASMQIMDDTLIYKGTDGVYAYSGSTAVNIGKAFGARKYSFAAAGTDGRRYYISMCEGTDKFSMFCFDTQYGLWLREDAAHARDFCLHAGELYFVAEGRIYKTAGGTETVSWSAQFAPFYETALGKKQYTRLICRLILPRGSTVSAQVRCDGGAWTNAGSLHGSFENTAVLRLPPARGDRFELRLYGCGECAVTDIVREFMIGSEV